MSLEDIRKNVKPEIRYKIDKVRIVFRNSSTELRSAKVGCTVY